MNTTERLRFAHLQFCEEQSQAHKKYIGSLAALYPELKEELQAIHEQHCRHERLRTALFELLTDNARAPIETIWLRYLQHIGSVPPSEPRRVRKPRQHRSKLKRQRILDVVVDRLKQGNPVDTAVICAEAGVGAGTIYAYFASQYDLIDQAYAALFESLLGNM